MNGPLLAMPSPLPRLKKGCTDISDPSDRAVFARQTLDLDADTWPDRTDPLQHMAQVHHHIAQAFQDRTFGVGWHIQPPFRLGACARERLGIGTPKIQLEHAAILDRP
jgi:hypothetical protein